MVTQFGNLLSTLYVIEDEKYTSFLQNMCDFINTVSLYENPLSAGLIEERCRSLISNYEKNNELDLIKRYRYTANFKWSQANGKFFIYFMDEKMDAAYVTLDNKLAIEYRGESAEMGIFPCFLESRHPNGLGQKVVQIIEFIFLHKLYSAYERFIK